MHHLIDINELSHRGKGDTPCVNFVFIFFHYVELTPQQACALGPQSIDPLKNGFVFFTKIQKSRFFFAPHVNDLSREP